jgi:hypothetical protein
MNDFLIDCFFKECCMARNFSRFAQRYIALGNDPALCRIARDNFIKGTVALYRILEIFGPRFFRLSTPYDP